MLYIKDIVQHNAQMHTVIKDCKEVKIMYSLQHLHWFFKAFWTTSRQEILNI